MIKLELTIDEINYKTLIPKLVPLIIKNKLASKTAQFAVSAKLNSLNDSERDKFVASFLNDHQDKILEKINSIAAEKGIDAVITDLNFS